MKQQCQTKYNFSYIVDTVYKALEK